MAEDFSDFLDAKPSAAEDHSAYLESTPNPGKSASKFKPYDPAEHSVISRLFMKYAPQELIDWAGGATGTMRGAANLVSPGAGEKAFPTEGVDKNSLAYVSGQVTDPAALAAGGVIGRGVQALPFVAKSAQMVNAAQAARTAGAVVPKVTKGAQVVNHVVAPALTGALTGGSTGYLASEGDLQDAGTAALYGAGGGVVVPAAFRAVKAGGGFLTDLVQGNAAKVRAGQIARNAAGTNLPAIRTALENAPDNLTAGQASFGINQDPWQALGQYGASRDASSYYRTLAEQQAAARQGMLTGVTPDLAAAEAQLKSANKINYGYAEKADQARLAALQTSVRPPAPQVIPSPLGLGVTERVPGVAAPVSTIKQLGDIVDTPNFVSAVKEASKRIKNNTNIPKVVRDSLSEDPASNMQGLHFIKLAIDDQLKNPNLDSSLKGVAYSELAELKSKLTAAMTASSKEYDAARKTAIELYKPVDQAKVLTNLRETLAPTVPGGPERVTPYFNALGRGEESALKRTGLDIRFGDTADVLTQPQMQTVNKVSDQLARDQAIAAQAKAGAGGLEQTIKDSTGKFRLPNLFNQKVALANKFLETADKYLSSESIKAISEGMKNGKSALEMLNTLPAADRNRWLLWAGQAGQSAGNMGVPGAVVGASESK